jgi:colanic acid biosynthesis protein WcaH
MPQKEIPIKLYKQIHASMPIPCVDAVVVDGGKALLFRRTNQPAKGQYWFPGGRVYKGETLKEAVLRKVKEETGLDVKIISQLGNEETIFAEGPFDGPTRTINTVFLVKLKKGDVIKIDSQHDDLKWVNKAPRESHTYIKKFIRAALALQKN